MALKLKWKNSNVVPTKTRIYRGDTPLSTQNLPAAIVELENGITEWLDETVKYGQTYYYVFEVFTDRDKVLTLNRKVEVTDKRGAGPNVLQWGNDTFGYFGTVLASEFFNSYDIYTACKNRISGALYLPYWHKFSRNGKTLFVPAEPIGTADFNWDNLYSAGLVFGVDGPGPVGSHGTLADTDQKTVLELNGDSYVARLPRGWSDNPLPDATLPVGVFNIQLDTDSRASISEVNDIILPIMSNTPKIQRGVNVDNIPTSRFFRGSFDYANATRGILCQERNNAGVLHRGVGLVNSTNFTRLQLSTACINNGPATLASYVPVLELQPEVSGD